MQTPSPSKLTPQGWRSWARPPRGSPPAQDAEHTLCYGSVLAALLGLSVEAWPDPQGSGRGSWRPPGALGGRDCGGDNAGPLGVGLTWAGSGRRWPGCSQSTLAPSPPLRQPPSPQPDTPEAVTPGNWGGVERGGGSVHAGFAGGGLGGARRGPEALLAGRGSSCGGRKCTQGQSLGFRPMAGCRGWGTAETLGPGSRVSLCPCSGPAPRQGAQGRWLSRESCPCSPTWSSLQASPGHKPGRI